MTTTRTGYIYNKGKMPQGPPVTDVSAAEPPDRGGAAPFVPQPVQHRSYQHTIQIYHFRTNFLSVNKFRKLLTEHAAFGYVDTLIGPDTQINLFRPDGDELPANTIEVAYLPNIFNKKFVKGGGFALGFRTHDCRTKKLKKYNMPIKADKTIEWFCFDRAIERTILRSWICELSTRTMRPMHSVDSNDPKLLFDHVADLWKGTLKRTVGDAHQEHKDWHWSLEQAHLRTLKLCEGVC
ncbi:hypothetical protein HBI25_213950 [Parastagonospora nodorum]|nr:hypothetical protein HBI76_047520 [Parastagonospora nodorum]KAH5483841.1 hypothetical protein HBI31_171870 [Parastagonospora nodorum]KAH5546749.1 hypothetical protein HBI25_213950 [Parastagonospora nodorum]KAH5548447.1 hypothetical protein HBI27_030260 [Parastagonospora nodorum]KAH6206993.1 hypothetical protein HBI53_130140 [Parastagonospora nodorum]